jgi:hypothetical protein
MPLDNTKETLAKIAYNEALRGGMELAEHFLEDAIWYVDEAIDHLTDEGTYDAETYAVSQSERAIIQYVKAKLEVKDPLSSQTFTTAKAQWLKRAALEWVDAQATPTNEEVIAVDVFKVAVNSGLIPEQRHFAEILLYLTEATEYLTEVSTYDPTLLAIDAADRARKIFATSRLNGSDPVITPAFVAAVNAWQQAAAREHYANEPDSYPDYPEFRKRIRDFSTKDFN